MAKDFTPRGAFQTEATKFLLNNPRSALHVDMGLGKTTMVLNAIDVLVIGGETAPFLIIAPKRVARSTWKEEAQKWNHLAYLKVSTVVGTPKQRLEALHTKADIYTINYENLEWLVKTVGDKWPFRGIVADESTKLKSHRSYFRKLKSGNYTLCCTGGKRTTAIARLAFTKTRYFWTLTGTPASNGLQDLWGPTWFLDKGKSLGSSYTAFEQRWFRKGWKGFGLEMLPHAENEIRKAIAHLTFTLRAEDYLILGKEIVNTIYVDLPEKARETYDEMEKNLFIEIEAGEVEVFTAAAKSQKCHQIANGAVYYDREGNWESLHDAKIEALESVIEEASGVPVIVVYKFKSDLIKLKKAFPKGVALDTSKKTEDNFKAGKIQLLFMHPDSGGHGIDGFQYVTNIICFFSLDWNAESRYQTIGRIGNVRQMQAGLNRPVIVHQIAARDTVDDIILDRMGTKMTVQQALKKGLARRNYK